MRLALCLAAKGQGDTRPNPPVGALVVKGGKKAGTGYHLRAGEPHAEIMALRAAGRKARGATLYVTLEPCCTTGRTGPCTEAILAHGVRRVVVCVTDPNPRHAGRGLQGLRRAGVDVVCGVCAEEGRRLIAPFTKWILTARPYLSLKLAVTLDGRIADSTGRSRWITGPDARAEVHALRRRADAVIVGRGTVFADDPSLSGGRARITPLWRVIVDSRGQLPLDARVLTDGEAARTVLATTRRCPAARRAQYEACGASVLVLPQARGAVSVHALLRALGRMGALHAVCEGGGELAASFLAAGAVDEYLLYTAPIILGGTGVPAVAGAGWRLGRCPRLRITDCRRVGCDALLRAVPLSNEPWIG
jgi:diaminohydroxyphosphoribosylaminopyrimidine deaminase / 5-amino-6-(5-phosphoribosylamino)uracil reductase